MGAWRRWGVVLLILAVAAPAAILAKGGEGGPINERDTSCWPCHVGWPAPLKTFYEIVPPAEAGAPVGEEFDYVVRLQGIWAPPGNGPFIKFVNPTLNLGGAPSLQFSGGPEPIPGIELAGSVDLQPSAPGAPVGSDYVVQEIPVGMTYVSVVLQPSQPTGPRFTMKIYTGTTEPNGSPKHTERAGDLGLPVEEVFEGDALTNMGTGNWTIEAVVDDLPSFGLPSPGGQAFTVVITARAETGGATALSLPQTTNVPKGASFLFTFGLKAVTEPAGDEAVGLTVNTTEYYKHKLVGTDDYANITKDYDQPLRVQTATDGSGRVIIVGPTEPPGAPAPFNGASMDTIAEVIGYGSGLLLISSIWTGGMFGKASRRQLNTVFGSAKRRVAFHNFLSYGIILFATVHTVLFIVETAYYWTLGVLWGGLAILSMAGLGVTGAWQVGMIRRWNYGVWRWSHYGLAVAAILFTLVHMGLDGVHFDFVQDVFDWKDPLDPRDTTG